MEKQRRQLTPEQDALEYIVACRDKPFLEEKFINSFKGKGVFTSRAIEPSAFVVEYQGKIFSPKYTTRKKKCGDNLNKYFFEFSWKGEQWCVDASKDDGTLGRLVNDDHISPNCEIKNIFSEGKPHLCLFAVTEISPGEEITYDYGDSSYPWRSMASYDGSSTSYSGIHATTSTPRNERNEDSSASSSDNSSSDDDDFELPDSRTSPGSDSFTKMNHQLDFMDNSAIADLDSSQEMMGTSMLQPDNASCSQQEDDSAFNPEELDRNGDSKSRKARPKPKRCSSPNKNYCYVCGKGHTKISRHLLKHAKEVPEIAEAKSLPKTSKKRKELFSEFRNRGNYQHNQGVLKDNSGELKLKRRPTSSAITSKTHVHCIHCKCMYLRNALWRHVSRCPSRTTPYSTKDGRAKVLIEIALSESPFSKEITPDVWKLLSTMKLDEISSAVVNDFLLIQLAQNLIKKHGNNQKKYEKIRSSLREMGRLLLALFEMSILSFEDAIKPKHFYKVVEAVKDLAGFDKKMQSYNIQSLPLKIGQSLKKICTIVLTGSNSNEQMLKDAKAFLKLFENEWCELVAQTSRPSLGGRKGNNPYTIPFTQDVQMFYMNLETTSASASESIEKYESPQVYNALCRVTLAQASVLSKCAPEVSKMTLETFQERDDSTQGLSKHFIRINVPSRRGQHIAALLTSEMVSAINLLVSKRKACGVHKDNPFVFAKPDSSPTSTHSGKSCMNFFSGLCGAKYPLHLTSLHLQMHLARIFQILNLESDELNDLSKLLSQDIRADRDYYRSPEAALELAKISKLLLAMEKGTLERFKGTSLDEIEIGDELESDTELDNSESDDGVEYFKESDVFLQWRDAAEQQGLTPEQDALEHIKTCGDKPFLEERLIDPIKGRGVFTNESIEPSTFVVEYRGNISRRKETRKKKCGDTLKNYSFDFSWIGRDWRITALNEDGTLGRLVNDNHISPNCEMKKIVYEGKPHLCLFTVTAISPGEEITYSYGDSSYPWRPRECSEQNTPQTDLNAEESSSEDESAEESAGSFSSAASSFEEHVDAPHTRQQDNTDSSSDEELKDPSFTKKNYCYVCGAAQTKISRHLFTHRNEEPNIAAVLKLRRNSKQRKALLNELRDRGNKKHNQEVLKTRCGELKVKRRPSIPTPTQTYAACLYCKNIFVREKLMRHMPNCSAKKSSDPQIGKRTQVSAAAESTDPKQISSAVRKLLKTLKRDDISYEIWNSPLLLQLAQVMYPRKETTAKTYSGVKLRLRQIGRLLLALKKKSICSLEDATKLQNFSKVVEAVRELSGFNEETMSCEKPTLMNDLGNSLKKIADISFATAWKENADTEKILEAQKFIQLCEKEWNFVPLRSGANNIPTIPFIHDVQLFYQWIQKTAALAVQSLTMHESSSVYTTLMRVTSAEVSVLNKKMAIVSKATLKSFLERDQTEIHKDDSASQSKFENILSNHTVKINVKTIGGQKVTATLTPKLITALTLLENKREACGVHTENPFLFARPDGSHKSFYQGHRLATSFAARCGAKNSSNLRFALFHKHIAKVFQIVSLTNDELGQLAKLLGRDIQTDREYYQTPDAAADIAKISVLLSAVEDGSLERYEGKSLKEIDIQDELELDNSKNNDAEEDNEESESSLLLRSLPFTKDSSETKTIPFQKKRRQAPKKRQDSDSSEMSDVENVIRKCHPSLCSLNTEKDDRSQKMPESSAVITPEKTMSPTNEDATHMSFSDGDDDMNADFDMDTDEDIVRNGENYEERRLSVTEQDNDSSDSQKNNCSLNNRATDAKLEETMEGDRANNMDVDIRSSPDFINAEKKNKLLAAVAGMKKVKILIPKLDIEKFQTSVHISQLPSDCNSVKSPVKDPSIHEENKQTNSTSKNVRDKPSFAKVTQMNCSYCKKSMMKGQTAYQKKGFTDVFCSKNCLFEIFPNNKPDTKSCHHCLKAISKPLDLIMAAVDTKGTIKDFCSPTCLISFKSNPVCTQTPQQLCSMCNKSCTTTCKLTLNEDVHTFCSNSCLEGFLGEIKAVCEICSSTCRNRPLKLEVDKETKTICSENCLRQFIEKINSPHQCILCHTPHPMSEMLDYKNNENMVKLFCSSQCVASYKLWPGNENKLQEKKSCRQRKKKSDKQSEQILNTEEGKISEPSTASENDASADVITTLLFECSSVACCSCGKTLQRGEMLYKPKSSKESFCSPECLAKKHPHMTFVTKTCYNCFQVILRPHKMIRCPVDDSGTLRDLCSDACLASVNSKRKLAAPKPPPLSECKMCFQKVYSKFKLTVDGKIGRICSDACLINYQKVNNLQLYTCGVCSSISTDKQFLLKEKDGSKSICSEECLVEFKQKIETPELCPMCRTSHQLSDMVENKNDEGWLDFFCSNRCMMVHRSQSSNGSGRNCPSPEDYDIKEVKPSLEDKEMKEVKILQEEIEITEVKPSLQNLDFIKEEPNDEQEYSQNLPSAISTQDIKYEPKAGDDVAMEDLKIGSVFSLTEDSSTSSAPTLAHMNLPASCFNCKQPLMDGETVFQRQSHAEIFCSTPCLWTFDQVKKTCHFCLQGITQPQDVLQAEAHNEGTIMDFCSKTCLSSFNYKRVVSTKISLEPIPSQSQCSVCTRYCISKHEIIKQDVVHKICSEPCFLRFCNINKLSICENCHSRCYKSVMLKTEGGSIKLCSAECLTQFKQKNKTMQPCAMCRTSHLMSEMCENQFSEDLVELFCNYSCVMAAKIQAVNAAGTPRNCDLCGKKTLPACHLAMSDASIRNFCSLTCAMTFKESHKDTTPAPASTTGAADQTQGDFLKAPETLPCAQCRRKIKSAPTVIEKKGKIFFLCSLACSQEFKSVNNITGKCEYCKNESIIDDVKKVNGKDCYFCSDGCRVFFGQELGKKWGKHCGSCAHCSSISKAVVTAKFEGTDKEFCSENCSSQYNLLYCHVAKCDTCGLDGELRQSLPLLGEIKHFCDLRCLLHFCNKKVQMGSTVSSPPRSSGTVESFPVIANVMSLASALAKHLRASKSSAQQVPVSDIQTKVVGHASVQTSPKQLKNKSMLCTPLVHNKGVSCTTQTVNTETQTDKSFPKVIVLPVPVPVYVPLPMNMYSQYTPRLVGLPIPLPVPVFLPNPTGKSMNDLQEGELSFTSDLKKAQDERKEREDTLVTKEGQRRENRAPKDHSSKCSDDLDSDHQATFTNEEDSSSGSSSASLSRPNNSEKPSPVLELCQANEPPPPPLELRGDSQSSLSPAPVSLLSQQTVGTVHNKDKGHKPQQPSNVAKAERSQREEVSTRKRHKLNSQRGIAAWKRWIQWRESQTDLDLVSSCAVTFNKDILRCSAAELSDSLCRFITEVKRPDGEPYPPDGLFYLCLSIQQYLFENARMENIFSDLTYSKFSTMFTQILKSFRPSVSASGYINSRVEEEFLWECKQLGAYSPIVLLNTLLFFCCKYFGFTTVEQHRQLSFTHVMRCTKTNHDNSKNTFLRFYPRNEAESDSYGIPAKKRKRTESKEDIVEMMENTENPLRCPVRLYQFYLSKCSESVRQRSDLFYLHPDQCCVPNSPLWFSSAPLDDSTMEAMLVRILAVRELQRDDRRGAEQQASDYTMFESDKEDSR
ncbi:uncharacterized protein LOC117536655 isoform X1 [Gymnodraco acuticeps]|uniref:Uncharacterized protein LOC117536655 isoform X1 n=2 Tax=Gymnodraco acuticeps TaxID=8218 RepID=A0A6P8T273_GYMAC|nr:uncharacterized protein LOC117536655 isoform X1 [Gymnodraco acuticeps]